MPKQAWRGSGNVLERLDVTLAVGQVRRAPKPPHGYGSPAMDLKREEAAAREAAQDVAKADDAD